jgi:hypothetical protein
MRELTGPDRDNGDTRINTLVFWNDSKQVPDYR